MSSENTKTEDRKPNAENRFVWYIFAAVIVFIYFFGLTVPLLGPDEPRYSQIAREMLERGDFVTPKLGGFDWFEKPALLYWLQIAAYQLFGITEFAARFGSAIFGLGTIFCLWILGKKVQNSIFKIQVSAENQNSNAEFANYLAIIAASSIGLIAFSRGASFDIILTFPITASLVGFYIYDLKQQQIDAGIKEKIADLLFLPHLPAIVSRYLPLSFFYFFIGVALIAKGLVGIVFPFAIIAFYYVLTWKMPPKSFIFSLFWGTIVSLIVASAWYLPMYQANGWKFIDEFFIQHHFQRYSSNKYQHPQPFWFFFVVLPLMTVPWLPFFLAAIWNFVKAQSSRFKVRDSKFETENSAADSSIKFFAPLTLFAFAWMLVPLVFFSLSGSKLPGYILPALPGALVLTAIYVFEFVRKSKKRRFFVKALAAAMFLVVAIIIQFFLMNYANHETVKNLVETAKANGYEREKIVNLYNVSHNLEFYASRRLLRDADGKQKLYTDFSVLVGEAKHQPNGQILALIPEKDVNNIVKETTIADSKIIARNGEHAIVLIKAK